MQQTSRTNTRKKFIWLGGAILAWFATSRIFGSQENNKTEKVKMLTEDGNLVEVDKSRLLAGGRKVTNNELQQWVKNKTAKR